MKDHTITRQEVEDRWIALRDNFKNTLKIEEVAEFLGRSESDLTKQKVRMTLVELANYRLEKGTNGWVNEDGTLASGDVVICEGLETFFVPAVEGTLSMQEFLESYSEKGQYLLKVIKDDIDNLLERWTKKGFEGMPYLKGRPSRVLKSEFADIEINLVESACMAIRVILHYYTLIHRSKETEKRFSEFFEPHFRNQKKSLEEVFSKALNVIIRAFQKGSDGKIGTAKTDGELGSGWSWCEHSGLPPMLYFTQCAVDAFTELDIYLIRPHVIDQEDLPLVVKKLYTENEQLLKDYQFCVDMSRRWVLNKVIKGISQNYGFYYEESANIEILDTINDNDKMYQLSKELYAMEDFERVDKKSDKALSPFVITIDSKEKELYAPFVEYNSLYALTIMLWSFGDKREDGEEDDPNLKAKIERALMQLIINYRDYPVIKKVLTDYPFLFTLPDVVNGEKIFSFNVQNEHQLKYEDSGYLTLLARILVLYGVYGVADHSVLDPIIQELYVDLLFAKNRRDVNYPNLWSKNDVEVFSTFRAVQTLTFYYAYQRGKEINKVNNTQQSPAEFFKNIAEQLESSDGKVSQNRTTKLKTDELRKVNFDFANYREFFLGQSDADWPMSDAEDQKEHLKRLESFGDRIIQLLIGGKIDLEKAQNVLKQLNSFVKNPWDKSGILRHEVRMEGLEERYFGS